MLYEENAPFPQPESSSTDGWQNPMDNCECYLFLFANFSRNYFD
jgi:hypothetical protein